MKRPYYKNMGTKICPIISSFYGIDTSCDPLRVKTGKASEMSNISAVSSPSLKPREGRKLIDTITGEVLFFGVIQGKYFTVVLKINNICYWKYYKAGWISICVVDESPTGKYDMLTFINKVILVTGKPVTVSGIEKTKHYFIRFDENEVMTFGSSTVMPVSDMAETINGRIAVSYSKNDKLYLGGIMNSDAWFVIDDGLEENVITQNGECGTALKSYNGHLVYFKPHSFGEIYGNTPDTYSMIMVSESIGCLSDKSCIDCGSLIWLSDNGILSYKGGALPKDISIEIRGVLDKLDKNKVKSTVAGTDGRRYIICLPIENENYINCVLNLETGEWFKEDSLHFKHFANKDGKLYGVDALGKIYILWDDTSTEEPLYEWVGNVTEASLNSSINLKRIYTLCDIQEGGNISVKIVNDSNEKMEETIAFCECNLKGRQKLKVNLHPKMFHKRNSFKIIITGQKSTIHSIATEGRMIEKSY